MAGLARVVGGRSRGRIRVASPTVPSARRAPMAATVAVAGAPGPLAQRLALYHLNASVLASIIAAGTHPGGRINA